MDKCLTDATADAAVERLTGNMLKVWVEGVFKSYRMVNGGSAAQARAEEREGNA